jgi:hypothetical protein
MRKLTLFLFASFLFALSLMAADFWQSKPFTEWNDKEVRKVLTSSPWAHEVSVALAGPTSAGRGERPGADELPRRPVAPDQEPGAGLGAPGGNVASREPGARTDPEMTQTLVLTVRWQSALPLKQALARIKYGAEAATSPEAKKFLDDNSTYLISVAGLPQTTIRLAAIKDAVKQQTTLSAKGQPALQPLDIVLSPQGKLMDLFFVFPKTPAFVLDDKEVEFSTKLGALVVKYKFRLKDMLFNGQLDL